MLSPSCLPCADNIANLGDGYFITMTMDEILDFMQDVHSLEVVLFSSKIVDAYEAFLGAGGATGTLIGAVAGVDAAGKALSGGVSSGAGVTTRFVVHSEPIPFDQETIGKRVNTKICGSAPVFSFAFGNTELEINFFAVERQSGLFYPRIDIAMENGSTSDRVGFIVGSVSFDRWGSIPIYNSSVCLVSGSIKIAERYSDLSCDSCIVSPSKEFTITSRKKPSTSLLGIEEIYWGRDSLKFRKAGSSIVVTSPKRLGQNRLLFRTSRPNSKTVNEFFFPEPITVQGS